MRRSRETGKISWTEICTIFAIVGILVAVIGGHYADKNAKMQKAVDINKNWEERNCDYFFKFPFRDLKNDAERVALYEKLFDACVKLRDTQPKTPQ